MNRSRLRKQVNICNQIINKAKRQFYSHIISENSGDSKKLWKQLNNILHSNAESILPEEKNEKSLANKFSSYFSDKITKICNGFNTRLNHKIHSDYQPVALNNFTELNDNDARKHNVFA